MSTGKAKELAREAAQHHGYVSHPVAEHAVSLTLEAACKAMCKRCRDGMAVANNSVHANPKGRRLICRAAAIRAMMEPQ